MGIRFNEKWSDKKRISIEERKGERVKGRRGGRGRRGEREGKEKRGKGRVRE